MNSRKSEYSTIIINIATLGRKKVHYYSLARDYNEIFSDHLSNSPKTEFTFNPNYNLSSHLIRVEKQINWYCAVIHL